MELCTHSGELVHHGLLLQDLQLEEGQLLLVVSLVQVVQRLELLQRSVGAHPLLLQRQHGTQRLLIKYEMSHAFKIPYNIFAVGGRGFARIRGTLGINRLSNKSRLLVPPDTHHFQVLFGQALGLIF